MRRNIDYTFLFLLAFLAYRSLTNGAFDDPIEWFTDKLMLLPAVLIGFSLHEYAHAYTAFKLGDPTPKFQGRVTINPLARIDWLGFAALMFCGFGWGVPVQINPANFRNRRKAELIVSLAGVTMNLIIAIVFAIVAKVLLMTLGYEFFSGNVGNIIWMMIMYIIQINLVLMIFNLIPCPPLDGFSVISEIFNIKHTELYWTLVRYSDFIFIGLIVFGITGMIISPCVSFLFGLLQNFIIF